MNNYFFLTWKNEEVSGTSAFAPKEIQPAHELIQSLSGLKKLPFDLILVKLTETETGLIESKDLAGVSRTWSDYQPNSLAWPLMSERMKMLIERYLVGAESVDWIQCKVRADDEERLYFILRFNDSPDVLDMDRTTFVPGTDRIIKATFSLEKVKRLSIFTRPAPHGLWRITSSLYINETLKKAMEKDLLTGVAFEKTRVL